MQAMETSPEPLETEESGPPSMPLGERFLNVLVAPEDLFEHLKASAFAASNWLVPAVIYVVVGWICATVVLRQDWVKPQMLALQEQGLQQQVERGKLTQEQANQALPMLEKYAMVGATVSGYAMPLLMGLAGPFLWGLWLWLVGTKILGGGFGYLKAVEVAGLAALIAALGLVVKTLLILIRGDLLAAPSAILLIPDYDPANAWHAFAGLLDVMAVWGLVIRSMGIGRLAGRSTVVVAVWVAGGWLLFFGGLTGLGLLAQRLTGG